MKIVIRRMEYRHRTTIERDDGVQFSIPAYGPEEPMPHDLAHAVVESALRFTDGFWGTIADGGILPGMVKSAGREPPHASERSLAVLKTNRRSLILAEVLVDILTKTLREDGTGDARRAGMLLNERAAMASPVREDDLARLYMGLHTMRQLWDATSTGESIDFDWPLAQPDVLQKYARR